MSRKDVIEGLVGSYMVMDPPDVRDIISRAYDAGRADGVLEGLRRAARLKHPSRSEGGSRAWDLGHDYHQQVCLDEAQRLAKRGRKTK
jgi:hypothetical protein